MALPTAASLLIVQLEDDVEVLVQVAAEAHVAQQVASAPLQIVELHIVLACVTAAGLQAIKQARLVALVFLEETDLHLVPAVKLLVAGRCRLI